MTDETLDGFADLRLDEQKPLHPTPLDDGWDELAADPDLAETWDMGPPSDPPDVRGLDDNDATTKMADCFLPTLRIQLRRPRGTKVSTCTFGAGHTTHGRSSRRCSGSWQPRRRLKLRSNKSKTEKTVL